MRRSRRYVFLLLWVLRAAMAPAQSPNGAEFQVNTITTRDQRGPTIAADPAGNFVVAWQSYVGPSNSSIRGQRYDGGGTPIGTEFQVSLLPWGYPSGASMGMDAAGNFVVAWTGLGLGNDLSYSGIQAQRFDARGSAIGTQFQVNSYTTGPQGAAKVAMNGAGEFVVVWVSDGSYGGDNSGASVQAQRFSAGGTPVGTQFQVNNFPLGNQAWPSAAIDDKGDFVVAWQSQRPGTPASYYSVWVQRYNSGGAPVGYQFQVNAFTSATQVEPAVAMDRSGDFVVVWTSYGWSATDHTTIEAQRYDASGVGVGSQMQVNNLTPGVMYEPAVRFDGEGSWIVAWSQADSSGTDPQGLALQARRFGADGSPAGPQFQVNTYGTGNQSWPAVAIDGSGNFIVAWHSDGSAGSDTSGYSVHAQRYDQLFRDGFETGDESRWPTIAP